MKFSMFSSSSTSNKIKVKLPEEPNTPTLRCLLNGPFKDLHFTVSEHRITPVHDVVFLDDVDNPTVTPLIYRPKRSTSPVNADETTNDTNGLYFESEE
ncbi:uncharacterized protein LOC135959065 [Calliphora vicina]|uniref:uncharacterized protein LOC135959065 n=1 Tax=Calliphora vicina TaxID=7373 RepID=UPI00325B3144